MVKSDRLDMDGLRARAYRESGNAEQYRFVMEFDGVRRLFWILDPVYAYRLMRDNAFLRWLVLSESLNSLLGLLVVFSIAGLPVALAGAVCYDSAWRWCALAACVSGIAAGCAYSCLKGAVLDVECFLAKRVKNFDRMLPYVR